MENIDFFVKMFENSGMTEKNGQKFIIFDQGTFFNKNLSLHASGTYTDVNLILDTFLNGTPFICKRLCTRSGRYKYTLIGGRAEFGEEALESWNNNVIKVLESQPPAHTIRKTSIYILYKNPDYSEPSFDFASAFECLGQSLKDYASNGSTLSDGTIDIIKEAFTYVVYNKGQQELNIQFDEDTPSEPKFKHREKDILDKHQEDLYNDMKEAVENEDFNTVYKLINFSFHLIDLGKTIEQKRKEYIRE